MNITIIPVYGKITSCQLSGYVWMSRHTKKECASYTGTIKSIDNILTKSKCTVRMSIGLMMQSIFTDRYMDHHP